MTDIVLSENSGGGQKTIISAGVHVGVCYGVFDIGTQESEWKGEKKMKHEIVIIWEVPEERIEIERDGKKVDLPRAISKRYTASLGEKANLRKDLEAWRSKQFTDAELKGFALSNIIGKGCQLQVVHKESSGKTFARIQSIMSLPKTMKAPPPENPTILWKIGDPTDGVPAWIIAQAQKAIEWVDEVPQVTHEEPAEDKDSEIPF